MAAMTPRRSTRIPHQHTPKMSERKKGLFQSELEASRDSLTKHRQLTVLESESESDECDLGIMGALDSSSCDENDSGAPKTPERKVWLGTRSQSKKILKETQDLKNFIKSPFTLKNYQNRYCPDKCSGSFSTPVTPHFQNHPGTPSSTHSCASVHTTSSTSSRARKSLASLIADTESCSSSLKDLNFDTDSGTDSKENTPSKSVRRSIRRQKMTPKPSFRGVLAEQKKNLSPMNPVVCLTKMDMSTMMSPTQMLKTPHNTSETNSANTSPPKLGPNRRSTVHIEESPESTCSSEKSQKRLNYDSKNDHGPNSKHPRLENHVPKARLSLFNSDRLKEILSTKSFYGKTNPDMNKTVTTKLLNAIEATQSHRRRLFPQSHSNKRKRNPGQINMGVRHRIRKPKIHNNKLVAYRSNAMGNALNESTLNSTASSSTLVNDSMRSQNSSVLSQDTSQELLNDKADPFDKEKQTIEALLSQWTEEEVPESEIAVSRPKQDLPCFTKSVIEETNQIFQPIRAIPVLNQNIPQDSEAVILELGAQKGYTTLGSQNIDPTPQNLAPESQNVPGSHSVQDVVMSELGHKETHGDVPNEHFLPVEGGYILVAENAQPGEEVVPDLDEIERELQMLDEQILQMAASNNINPDAVLASTEPPLPPVADTPAPVEENMEKTKLFPIFSKPNPGTPSTPTNRGSSERGRRLLRSGKDQLIIDAGQKKFGATQCNECGVIYQIGDPQDEHDHLVHHNATDVLRFNGLKEECVVGVSGSARCVRVRMGPAGGGEGVGGARGGAACRRVRALLQRVVHPQLGYCADLRPDTHYTAYLYIDKRQIVGCLVAEPRLRAHKLIPGEPDCCSLEEYPVKCGVSRIWTHAAWRRRGVASRLLDCARASFLYGAALARHHLAFSAPTPQGKLLATSYCGTENFYVYLD